MPKFITEELIKTIEVLRTEKERVDAAKERRSKAVGSIANYKPTSGNGDFVTQTLNNINSETLDYEDAETKKYSKESQILEAIIDKFQKVVNSGEYEFSRMAQNA